MVIVLACIGSEAVTAQGADTQVPARAGVMDFSTWRYGADFMEVLDGEWLAYSEQILDLDDLSRQPLPQSISFTDIRLKCASNPVQSSRSSDISLESALAHAEENQAKSEENQTQVEENQACVSTYVLELRHLPGLPLSVFIPEIPSAFRLSWNDVPIAEGGWSDTLPALVPPRVGHQIVPLPEHKGEGVLILQIANVLGIEAVLKPLEIGERQHLQAFYSRGELFEALSAAIAGIAGLLLLLQQKARYPYEKGLWGLALFGFATLGYVVTEGFTVIRWFWDDPHWLMVTRINMISQQLFVPALVIWLTGIYQGVFGPWYIAIIRLQLLLVAPALGVMPETFLLALEPAQMLFNLFLGLLCLGALLGQYGKKVSERAEKMKEPHGDTGLIQGGEWTLQLILALLVAVACASHDILLYHTSLSGTDWLPAGFAIFLVSQIFFLAVARARQHARLGDINQQMMLDQQELELRLDRVSNGLNTSIRQVEELNHELRYLSDFDSLTGLLRQPCFVERADRFLTGIPQQDRACISLLVLDLDRYKELGALYGPDAADLAMKEIAQLIRQRVHDECLCSRLEGESFAVLLSGMTDTEALNEAELLRLRLSQRPVRALNGSDQECTFYITASVGVYSCPVSGAEIMTMLDAAELALNRAKASGRNCVVGYNQLPDSLTGSPLC